MRLPIIVAVALTAATCTRAVCPDGWVGIGYSQLCQILPGDNESVCGGYFGTIFANDCGFIAENQDSTGDWCAGGYDNGASVSCEGGYQTQPYFVVTSGGNFGNCEAGPSNNPCSGFEQNNPIFWCCSRS